MSVTGPSIPCSLLLVLAAPLAAQEPAARLDRTSRWRADLAFLAKTLPARHANLFFRLSKEDFAAAVARLDARIGKLADDQILTELMRLVASAGDGHTALTWPRGARLVTFPLRFYWFEDGITLVRAPKEHEHAVGARLVRVGDTAAAAVAKKLAAILAHDNEAALLNRVPQVLPVAEVLHGLGITKQARHARFLVEDADGDRIELSLDATPLGQGNTLVGRTGPPPLFERRARLDFWNRWLADSKTLYFKYNRCRNPRQFQRLVRGTFNFLNEHPADRFVLDLRDNGGGNSAIFAPLLSRLLRDRRLDRKGHLFVIIGRRTFSSAVLNALDMRRTKAVFAGEPTGGRPNHYGEVRFFELPYSRLRVSYSTKFFRRISDADPPSLEPDILVRTTSRDWVAGRDPVLAAVLGYVPK